MPVSSLASFFAPRILDLPSTAAVLPEMQYWARQATLAVNELPPFSRFSLSSPESQVTAQAGIIGVNLAPASVASGLWFKKLGSAMTGWVAIA